MPRINPIIIAQQPDLTQLPVRVDRAIGAALVSRFFFPTTARSIETWPVEWIIVNGKAVTGTEELFQIAQAKLDTARPSRVRYQARRTTQPATAAAA
jgi:hypothetical protein